LATKGARYVTLAEAVFLHIRLMRLLGERRYGVFDRALVESALARPQQAAAFENADLIRPAATLYFGLVKNHPWVGGNKRTATAITDEFLFRNGYEVTATTAETVEVVLAVEGDRWGVGEGEGWLRERAKLIPFKVKSNDCRKRGPRSGLRPPLSLTREDRGLFFSPQFSYQHIQGNTKPYKGG
jgi:death-on-curing protein